MLFPFAIWVVYLRSGWSFFSSVVVTALKDEASVLGIPAGVLSARTAANLIEKISMESDQTTLLSAEQRVRGICQLHVWQGGGKHIQVVQAFLKMK